MKKRITSLIMVLVMLAVLSFSVDGLAASEDKGKDDDIDLVKEYCEYYGIDYIDSDEYIKEVQSMIDERGFTSKAQRVKKRILKKQRNIPDSKVSDIIWTNNPATPWNHVGIYTATNMITEALSGGVKSRYTGSQQEYAFEIYKVVKKEGSDRYSVVNRSSVAAWALKQVGKDYDYNFYDNKQDTNSGNSKFNCSELVYKSWVLNGKIKVDLDSDGGNGVFPNDIRDSKRTVLVTKG